LAAGWYSCQKQTETFDPVVLHLLRMKNTEKKRVPKLRTDKAAAAFLAQSLSQLDFSQFQPVRFEFERKDKQLDMRVPAPLLAALKAKAKERGIPYTRLIRQALERAISRTAA
jgi:predicted DNA binding CopG/RHH family protein